MEQLLHYVWKHKIFLHSELTTTDGKTIEVIDPGLANTNAGPDFTGAKIRIDGVVWAGNVEIHQRTSDWFRHHHHTDEAYSNIILHVAAEIDCPLRRPNGQVIPQLQIRVPDFVSANYDELRRSDHQPRCAQVIGSLPLPMAHSWMAALAQERLEQRNRQIAQRHESLNSDWEHTLFVTIARNFGFGLNGDTFEAWAKSIPLSAIAKHRDSLFQIEAIFFGQSGLLFSCEASATSEYHTKLCCEYEYLKHKFALTPIPASLWRFLRLRPQNFPHVRIAQLAMLYYEQRLTLTRLINSDTTDDLIDLLSTHVSDYWQTHYNFSSAPSTRSEKSLSKSSTNLLIINSIAPLLFAYGKYKSDQRLCDRAFSLWQSLPPENNRHIRNWANAGIKCKNAADSQALMHLTLNYCEPRNCLRCQFGYEFIRHTPSLLCEE